MTDFTPKELYSGELFWSTRSQAAVIQIPDDRMYNKADHTILLKHSLLLASRLSHCPACPPTSVAAPGLSFSLTSLPDGLMWNLVYWCFILHLFVCFELSLWENSSTHLVEILTKCWCFLNLYLQLRTHFWTPEWHINCLHICLF